MVWKMTCRTLPKANLVQAEIYQVHTNIGIFTNVIFDDTGELMCWTSASGKRKSTISSLHSAVSAAENACAFWSAIFR